MKAMRRLLVGGLLAAMLGPSAAAASPVLVLDGTQVRPAVDPWIAPEPALPGAGARAHAASAARAPVARAAAHRRTVIGELKRLLAAGAIDTATYIADRTIYEDAVKVQRKLQGTRRTELGAVLATLDSLAARNLIRVGRLPALFLTLQRNRQWWTTGSLLAYGQRVEFTGSRLVWQEYPGQGLQLQMLASFGKANGLLQGHFLPGAKALLAELIPLAAKRGGGIAWESYFAFDGGRAPWVSAMTEGTAVQALARASVALADPSYLDVARSALGIFRVRAPTGVRVRTASGAHYLLYSFAPGVRVLNGFIQSLNGLFDLWQIGGVAEAEPLYEAGLAEARIEAPRYDTGSWSLYQPGVESSLDYHELVRDFLQGLCDRSAVEGFCTEAGKFTSYLTRAPSLTLITRSAHQKRMTSLRFRLSKISTVGITVSWKGQVVLATSATFGRGVHSLNLVPRHSGLYTVVLFGRDLAGNTKRVEQTMMVHKPPTRHHPAA